MAQENTIYSSKATFSVLTTLAEASAAVSFRELIRRSDLGIRSAQLAVKKLLKEKLLSVTQFKNQTLYKLTDNAALDEIRLIVEYRKNQRLAKKAAHYSKNLTKIIKSTDELVRFSRKIRKLNPNTQNG